MPSEIVRAQETPSAPAETEGETPALPDAPPAPSAPPEPKRSAPERLITLDFNNVDLTVFVKFVSEITGKNFIIDERVRGKVTIFSPTKIPVGKVYEVFLSVMELKGFSVMTSDQTIQILPSSEVPPEREIFVHFLENANAEETAKLISGIAVQVGIPAAPGRPAAGREFEGQIQVTPDKSTNALIIKATRRDYEKIKEIVRQLDIKRRQVFVEAVIMEVGEDRLRELGTDIWAVGGYVSPNEDVAVIGGINQTPENALDLFSDLGSSGLAEVANINIRAVLQALQSFSDVNVLSTPQILTMDNQKARIVVGQNVPFVTGTTTTTGGAVQTTVQRQDVGVTLELTPQVMEGDKVRLDVRQEISSVTETAESVLVSLGPTTNKREAMTSVIVHNHQTVVIGGLMRDDVTRSQRKIPLLGDIPLLGWMFKFQSDKVLKTNLLIFLTPHILYSKDDLTVLREKKTDEIKKVLAEQPVDKRQDREKFLDAISPPVSDAAE